MDINLCRQRLPDATTLMEFRHLLEASNLAQTMLLDVNTMHIGRDLLMTKGTLVNPSLIAALGSMKNKGHARDPEIHQPKKGE
jgi:IS5 family transposase